MKKLFRDLSKKWKDINLKTKFAVSFGTIALFIITLSLIANTSIYNIVNDTESIIESSSVQSNLEHHHEMHLRWVSSVNKLLTNDQVTVLDAETDHTLCEFGKWYYSNERKKAEELIPDIAPILEKFEKPHQKLHASASEINKVFQQGDRKLSEKMTEVKMAHLLWMNELESSILSGQANYNIELNPNECIFGTWLHSDYAQNLSNKNPQIKEWLEQLHEPHEKLHRSARGVNNALRNGNRPAALQILNSQTSYHAKETLAIFDEILNWNKERLKTMDKADSIYNAVTLPTIDELSVLFDQVSQKARKTISANNENILAVETASFRLLLLVSILVISFSVLAGIFFSRFIIRNVNKEVRNAERIASGDLTDTIQVFQKDELGTLAAALETMRQKLHEIISNISTGAETISQAGQQLSSGSQTIAQGANEQASSIEEISSTMEETNANVQQTHQNAEETRKVLARLSEQIDISTQKGKATQDAMDEITQKISIINDIAHQTNILALNAAVEAARAGQEGKGFAVVASEIRKLAERSRDASNEINRISQKGISTSSETSELLASLVPLITDTINRMDEVVAASAEQNNGVQQINSAIDGLNQITQQNAAGSEEMSANAEELDGQSSSLEHLTTYFKIK